MDRKELRRNIAAYVAIELFVTFSAALNADPDDPFGCPVYLAFVALTAHLAFMAAEDVGALRRMKG